MYRIDMQAAALISLKVIALTIIMIICYIVAGSIVQLDAPPPEQAGSAGMALMVMCFLNTLVLTYIILRSRWTGVRLMAVTFFVIYGVTTIMSQMETAVFVTLPPGVLPRLFLMGVLVAAPFSVLAVLILGKGRNAA